MISGFCFERLVRIFGMVGGGWFVVSISRLVCIRLLLDRCSSSELFLLCWMFCICVCRWCIVLVCRCGVRWLVIYWLKILCWGNRLLCFVLV